MAAYIRPITAHEDLAQAELIRGVLTEFGANREGFAFVDEELQALSRHFIAPKAGYWVAFHNEKLVGGAGFGPLLGGPESICELKKMYLLPEARGLGVGRELMEKILQAARTADYKQIYLETTEAMNAAKRLYEGYGFARLAGPLGATGHFGCDVHYLRDL